MGITGMRHQGGQKGSCQKSLLSPYYLGSNSLVIKNYSITHSAAALVRMRNCASPAQGKLNQGEPNAPAAGARGAPRAPTRARPRSRGTRRAAPGTARSARRASRPRAARGGRPRPRSPSAAAGSWPAARARRGSGPQRARAGRQALLISRKANCRAATHTSNCWRRPSCSCCDPVRHRADARSCPPVTQPPLPQADATLLTRQSGRALRVAAAQQPALRIASAWLSTTRSPPGMGPRGKVWPYPNPILGSAAPGRARLRHARAALRLLVPPAGPAQPLACAPPSPPPRHGRRVTKLDCGAARCATAVGGGPTMPLGERGILVQRSQRHRALAIGSRPWLWLGGRVGGRMCAPHQAWRTAGSPRARPAQGSAGGPGARRAMRQRLHAVAGLLQGWGYGQRGTRAVRERLHAVAGLVHGQVAALAEDDEVRRRAVAAGAHRAQRLLLLAAVRVAVRQPKLRGARGAVTPGSTRRPQPGAATPAARGGPCVTLSPTRAARAACWAEHALAARPSWTRRGATEKAQARRASSRAPAANRVERRAGACRRGRRGPGAGRMRALATRPPRADARRRLLAAGRCARGRLAPLARRRAPRRLLPLPAAAPQHPSPLLLAETAGR